MKRWNVKGFYGSYGHIVEHNDKTASIEIIWNTSVPLPPYRKNYKTLRGAKIALGRMLDSYTLEDVTHLLNE